VGKPNGRWEREVKQTRFIVIHRFELRAHISPRGSLDLHDCEALARFAQAHRGIPMNGAVLPLVLFTFVTGIAALLVLVASLGRDRRRFGVGADVIFDRGEQGHTEDPTMTTRAETDELDRVAGGAPATSVSSEDVEARRVADVSSRGPVLAFATSAVFWLVVGSLLGLVASLKMTFPDWLVSNAALTFGRVRPLHLNLVIYGWASMAGIAVALWLTPRLARHPLVGGHVAVWAARVWNVGMVGGAVALARGWTDGVEWLEFPWQVDVLFVVGGALAGFPLLATLTRRRAPHLYVSAWYLGAALLWFPILFLVANMPGLHFGVEHATMNWWFAHNVLGLWLTPIGLAIAYYFIPKILGRPVFSYGLSLVGFWSLALFYSQVGMHHLIGGPVPTWLVTISVVHSVMMFVPVIAVGINHHFTMLGRFGALKQSPTLRFVVVGAMMYTLTSFEGSLESLRSINRVTHFTHFTVGHAHFGVYGFVSFELFGALYFLLPRLLERDWPRPGLIRAHFWLALSGIAIYVLALTVGGLLQGFAMLDPATPFLQSVAITLPWLHLRTLGGVLMTAAHLVFAYHAWAMITRRGPARVGAPWAEPNAGVSS
jgi:cytochrome c oxidase cbb3-type subunit 1